MLVLYGAVDINYTTIYEYIYITIYAVLTWQLISTKLTVNTSSQLIIYLKYDNKRNVFYIFWPTTFNWSLPSKYFKLILFIFKWYVIIYYNIYLTAICSINCFTPCESQSINSFSLNQLNWRATRGAIVRRDIYYIYVEHSYNNLQTVYIYINARLIEQSEKEKEDRELKNSDNAATCARFAFTTFAAFILIYLLCWIFFTDCR